MGEWRHIDMVRPDSPTDLPSCRSAVRMSWMKAARLRLVPPAGRPRRKPPYSCSRTTTTRSAVSSLTSTIGTRMISTTSSASIADSAATSTAPATKQARGGGSRRWAARYGRATTTSGTPISLVPTRATPPGTGAPKIDPDLHDVVNDTNTGNVNDSFTSAQFFPDCQGVLLRRRECVVGSQSRRRARDRRQHRIVRGHGRGRSSGGEHSRVRDASVRRPQRVIACHHYSVRGVTAHRLDVPHFPFLATLYRSWSSDNRQRSTAPFQIRDGWIISSPRSSGATARPTPRSTYSRNASGGAQGRVRHRQRGT